MVRKTALVLALIASPAAAQTASTNCYYVGTTLHCDTQSNHSSGVNWGAWSQPAPAADPMAAIQRGYEDAQARRRLEAEQAARQSASQHAEAAEQTKMTVAEKLRAGDCAGAIDAALSAGDIDLAAQARSFCAMPAPAK